MRTVIISKSPVNLPGTEVTLIDKNTHAELFSVRSENEKDYSFVYDLAVLYAAHKRWNVSLFSGRIIHQAGLNGE